MQFKNIMAMAAVAVSLGGLAQPAHSEGRVYTPDTSEGRVELMMRNVDRFMARQDLQEQNQRYYVERQRTRSDQYAMRSSRQQLRR